MKGSLDMKKILAILLATVTALSVSSCMPDGEIRDLYEYDTFYNAEFGADPEEVFADLGLSKKQVARQPESVNAERGYPDGTFSYKITKYASMYGTPVEVELLFANRLFEIPTHIGLYAVKVNFIEDYPDNFAANSVQWEPSDYKLDIEMATEEIEKRLMFNTIFEEYKDGDFSVKKWSCSNTPNTVGEKLTEKLVSVPSEGGISINDRPLSTMEVYYDNPNEASYILYTGLSAAVLENME